MSVIFWTTQLFSANGAVIKLEKAINKVHTVMSGSRCSWSNWGSVLQLNWGHGFAELAPVK